MLFFKVIPRVNSLACIASGTASDHFQGHVITHNNIIINMDAFFAAGSIMSFQLFGSSVTNWSCFDIIQKEMNALKFLRSNSHFFCLHITKKEEKKSIIWTSGPVIKQKCAQVVCLRLNIQDVYRQQEKLNCTLSIMVWGLNLESALNGVYWFRKSAVTVTVSVVMLWKLWESYLVYTWEMQHHKIQTLVNGGEMQNDNQVNYFHPTNLSNVYHSRWFYSLFVTFAALTKVYTKVVFEGPFHGQNILCSPSVVFWL